MKELLTFDDVVIVPKFSHIDSRKDVDLSSTTSKKCFYDIGSRLPVISANMDTVTGPAMAKAMLNYGADACLHRFCSIEENVKAFQESEMEFDEDCRARPMVSIGLGQLELERAEALYSYSAIKFVIDVANGGSMAVVKQVKALKKIIGDNGAIIVGNFATGESIQEFMSYLDFSVQGFKVGISPGSSCTTRVQTGVGIPQFSAIQSAVYSLKGTGIPVIADGGIKKSGDVAKALGAGAHLVMIGGMLAGTEESPGERFWIGNDGELIPKSLYYPMKLINDNCMIDESYIPEKPGFKKYRGSASKESYVVQGKEAKHRTPEGESFLVPYKGPVADVLQDIEGDLRSAFTYTNSITLEGFHLNCEFARVTGAGYIEGTPHGKKP